MVPRKRERKLVFQLRDKREIGSYFFSVQDDPESLHAESRNEMPVNMVILIKVKEVDFVDLERAQQRIPRNVDDVEQVLVFSARQFAEIGYGRFPYHQRMRSREWARGGTHVQLRVFVDDGPARRFWKSRHDVQYTVESLNEKRPLENSDIRHPSTDQ